MTKRTPTRFGATGAVLLALWLAAPMVFGEARAADPRDVARDAEGRAVAGYDATAYFRERRARDGRDAFTHRWRGAIWRFARASDRDAFAADPGSFAPQFGGHCANGLSEGHLVHGHPRVWLIVDGRLYLFFAERGRRIWRGLPDARALRARIALARRNWQRLRPSAR